ncbi:MAG TPA: hypothetical protein VIZ86_08090 [Pseudomonas sp.]
MIVLLDEGMSLGGGHYAQDRKRLKRINIDLLILLGNIKACARASLAYAMEG